MTYFIQPVVVNAVPYFTFNMLGQALASPDRPKEGMVVAVDIEGH